MQILIDIDEDTYNDIKKGKIYSSFRDVPLESVNAIANGTPLDDLRAEISKLQTYKCFEDTEKLVALDEVLQIIDKYKAESED